MKNVKQCFQAQDFRFCPFGGFKTKKKLLDENYVSLPDKSGMNSVIVLRILVVFISSNSVFRNPWKTEKYSSNEK